MSRHVLVYVDADHGDVWFRLALGESDGRLHANFPPRRWHFLHPLPDTLDRPVVWWISSHFEDQIAIKEFEVVVLCENAHFRQAVVLRDSEAAKSCHSTQ